MTKRINSLQSMRLVASLLVFQYHLWNNYLNLYFLAPGTDFFIVLVGFVAAVAQSRSIPKGNWKKYISRRYIRLYITFIPVFMLYVLSGRDAFDLEYFVKSFFFIPMPDKLPLVGPTWMLTMFLVFYWLFSLTFLFRRENILIPIFVLWGAGSIAYSWFQWDPGLPLEWSEVLFSYRNLEFAYGYIGGKLLLSGKIKLRPAGWILAAGIGGVIPGLFLFNTGVITDPAWRAFLYGIPITLIVLGLGALEQNNSTNGLLKVLIHPWFIWLGATSYVMYLIHNMVLRIWDTLIPITPMQTPLITIAVIAASAIGYNLWEKPALEYVYKKAYRQST